MGILAQLNNPTFKVTKSDKILIEYINSVKDTVLYKSISEIAKESELGEATITRFTKKLGYSGFQEFKIILAKELSIQEERNILHTSISCFENVHETANKLLHSTIDVLEQTISTLDASMVDSCASAILASKKIYLIGIGHSGMIAMDFNYKLMRTGLNTFPISDSHTMLMMASIMNEGDVVLAISHSGQTKEIIQTARVAQQQGAKIISLTEDKSNNLRDIADIQLTYCSNETLFEAGSFNSKIPQMFILDLIYTEMIKDRFDEILMKKVKTTETILAYKSNLL